jgi:hypothetical protein
MMCIRNPDFIAATGSERRHTKMTHSRTAEYLHCSEAYVSKLLRGKVHGVPPLPCMLVGRRVSISKRALNTWLWDLEARQRGTRERGTRQRKARQRQSRRAA